MQQELNLARQSVRLLEFQLKEKDQEYKLCELKVKELRKTMPNVKIKPMINKRKTDLSLNGDLDDYTIRNKRGVREIKSLRARKYT